MGTGTGMGTRTGARTVMGEKGDTQGKDGLRRPFFFLKFDVLCYPRVCGGSAFLYWLFYCTVYCIHQIYMIWKKKKERKKKLYSNWVEVVKKTNIFFAGISASLVPVSQRYRWCVTIFSITFTHSNMVKPRSKPSDEPAQPSNRKRQPSNASEAQNKRAKVDDDEESSSKPKNKQNKKTEAKATKKKGKQPR